MQSVLEFLSSFHIMFRGLFLFFQAFINTAAKIYQKIEEGVFDVSNEVSVQSELLTYTLCMNLYVLMFCRFCIHEP